MIPWDAGKHQQTKRFLGRSKGIVGKKRDKISKTVARYITRFGTGVFVQFKKFETDTHGRVLLLAKLLASATSFLMKLVFR